MIIDFHTHTFPDKIADKAIATLMEKGGVPCYRKGTLSALQDLVKESGMDYAVSLPVATSAKQVESINRLSAEVSGQNGVIFGGAIHPDCENVEEILDYVKSIGLKVIKIHPDYQGVYFDDERYIRILKAAAERDLMIVTHAGRDVAYPDDVHCTPDMVLYVLDKLKGLIENKLILAHLGACDMPDEVLEKLIGKPVYFDTAVVLDRYTEKSEQIIKAHGADKILFATDSPWAPPEKFIKLINSFDLTQEEKDKIFGGNARKILGI